MLLCRGLNNSINLFSATNWRTLQTFQNINMNFNLKTRDSEINQELQLTLNIYEQRQDRENLLPLPIKSNEFVKLLQNRFQCLAECNNVGELNNGLGTPF